MFQLRSLAFVAALLTATQGHASTLVEQISPHPAAYAEGVDYAIAQFNPPSADVTALVFATSGTSDLATAGLALGCEAGDFGGVSGKVALISRGDCPFVQKVLLAQAAGALGLLIVENDPSATLPVGLGGADPSILIPTFRLTLMLGGQLADLARAQPVTIRLAIGDGLTPSGAPEPAGWLLMLLGFSGLGGALRVARTRRVVSPGC